LVDAEQDAVRDEIARRILGNLFAEIFGAGGA
jgi:hypothetical protein